MTTSPTASSPQAKWPIVARITRFIEQDEDDGWTISWFTLNLPKELDGRLGQILPSLVVESSFGWTMERRMEARRGNFELHRQESS